MATFKAGYDLHATWQPTGGSLASLNITNWDWSEKVMKLVTTHTGSGGVAACIPGILDGTCRIQANYDIAKPSHANPPFIRAGAKGVIALNTGLSAKFSIPCMIEEVHYQSAVDGLIKYDFSVAMDSGTGAYVYPA